MKKIKCKRCSYKYKNIKVIKMAKKKCATKNCENEFIQYNSLTKYCIPCAIKLAKPRVQKETIKKEKERKRTERKIKDSKRL